MKQTYKKPETKLVAVKLQQMIALSLQSGKATDSEVLGRDMRDNSEYNYPQQHSVWED